MEEFAHTVRRAMFFLGLLLATIVGAIAPSDLAASSQAPVYAHDFPDPMVTRVGDDFYAYSTQTPWEKPGTALPVLHSTDLVHWTYAADALAGRPAWALDEVWAPSVIARNGQYYLFYSARNFAKIHCLAVATAAAPTGPFADRGPLSCGDDQGNGYIDAAPYVDESGAWLYFSVDRPEHSISVLPLSADLLHVTGPRTRLFGVSQEWEHGPGWTTVEGPYVVRRGDTYYLFYSGNDWQHDYAEGVATASSPTGPFTKSAANPILQGNPALRGPGGASLFQGPDGETWMAYHAWTAEGRSLHVERVCWADGRITVGC